MGRKTSTVIGQVNGDWRSCRQRLSENMPRWPNHTFIALKLGAQASSFRLIFEDLDKISKPFRLLSSDWTTGYPREVVRAIRPLCATVHRRRLTEVWHSQSQNGGIARFTRRMGCNCNPSRHCIENLFLSNMVIKNEYQLDPIGQYQNEFLFCFDSHSQFSKQFSHSFICTRFWIKAGLAPVLGPEG